MIAVFTCDIIGSRNYPTPQRSLLNSLVKDSFAQACAAFPQTQADYLSFSITQGDEFQFNAESIQDFYGFLLFFRSGVALSELQPVPFFRCGIGFGERATVGENSYEMDGSAYYFSRTALNGFAAAGNLNALTRTSFAAPLAQSALNSLFMFCDRIERNWSREQRQAVWGTLRGLSQGQVAAELKTTQQNISKLLKNASWTYLESVSKLAGELINPDTNNHQGL